MNDTFSIRRLPSPTWVPAQTDLSWVVSLWYKEHRYSRLWKFTATMGQIVSQMVCVICLFEKYHICFASISKLAACNCWICTEQFCFLALRTSWACCNQEHHRPLSQPKHQLVVRSLPKTSGRPQKRPDENPNQQEAPGWPLKCTAFSGSPSRPHTLTHSTSWSPARWWHHWLVVSWAHSFYHANPFLPPCFGCISEPTFFSVF